MGQITSGVGLVSGLNTGAIISALISLDQQPITLLQSRVTSANAQKQAFAGLGAQLQALQLIGQSLENPTSFAASTAQSSDQSVLTGTAGVGAAVGSYNFNVASLVTSQQAISNGYSSPNSLVGAGTLTISQGGGEANSQTTLAQLNGGTGVRRGQFRITDGSGSSSVIDISTAVTLDDVVGKINSSLNVSVHASIKDNQLVLQDASGQNKSNFTVQDLGNGNAAADLGIVGNTSGATITGKNVNTISTSTPLSYLNDGRGVGTARGASDFQVNLADGSQAQVSLGSVSTVGDVLTAINKVGGTKFKASLDAANNRISIADTTTGSGSFSIAALNNSSAAKDLGIDRTTSGTAITGNTLLASLDSVLVTSLNGGNGLPLGTIRIADRTGAAANINLAGAKSVQDILTDINKSGLHVTASLNNASDGLQLTDTSGSSGNLVISDVSSTTAQALGIAGTYDDTHQVVSGGDLHTQFISSNTLLSNYNGGKGVNLGSFSITNSKGVSATVDLSQGTFNTIGDVISAINAKSIGVGASLNANGDGILLSDSAGGGTKLTVADVSGTAAADLNIKGVATGTTLDGAFTKTITVTAADTLTTLQDKVHQLGFGATANIVNDGSGNNGYHLAFTSYNSGRNGRVVIDGGTTSLTTQNIVKAQDAAVFFGGSNSAQSLLVTGSTNQLTGVIPGVSLQLQSTGAATLNVSRDSTAISSKLQSFSDTFNAIVDQIGTLTKYDSTTNQAGLLLGDSTTQSIQQKLYDVYDSVVKGSGQFQLFSDVGLSLGDGAKLSFDSTKFAAAYASDPDSVKNLFTQATTGLGSAIDKGLATLIDPVNGSVTAAENTITTEVSQFQGSITQLNFLLDAKKAQLTQEFANMEVVLAGLQGQQSALSSINSTLGGLTTSTKSSSSSSNSTSSSSSSG